ncbi:MAG TPA: hypothetical protein VL442_14775 [Mucilaginibacter sp.]|jgi:hypothetical protein|nr:hypothetical protein [Mucilaginibacter sp.]
MDKSMFLKHIDEFEFQNGIVNGMWGFHNESPTTDWPHVTIWVQTSTIYYAPGKCDIRFTLDGYPVTAPNAVPWSIENKAILASDQWPKGHIALDKVFKPSWKTGGLYAPYDRLPLSDHPNWPTEYPDSAWRKTFKITEYLLFIHKLLNQP